MFFKNNKNKIKVRLDEIYINQDDFRNAVVDYLRKKGYQCEAIGKEKLMIDNDKYFLLQYTSRIGQKAVLKKIEE